MVHLLFLGAAAGLCIDAHTFSAGLVSEVESRFAGAHRVRARAVPITPGVGKVALLFR